MVLRICAVTTAALGLPYDMYVNKHAEQISLSLG